MIGRLTSAFEDLNIAPLLGRQLSKHIFQHAHGDESGATACYQDSVSCQEPQGKRLQAPIGAQRFLDGVSRARKLRRIKHDQVKSFPGCGQGLHLCKHVGPKEGDAGKAVDLDVFPSESERWFGNVDSENRGRPSARGVASGSTSESKVERPNTELDSVI